MLTLPIKRKWFDMICRGEKREEYREPTDYWKERLFRARGRAPENEIPDPFHLKSKSARAIGRTALRRVSW